METLLLIFSPLSILLILLLGVVVLLKDPKNRVHLSFFGICLSLSTWLLTNFIVDTTNNLEVAFFFSKLAIMGPVFAAPISYYFSLIFPLPLRKFTRKEFFVIILGIMFFLILLPTRFNIEKVWTEEWGVSFRPGPLYYFLFFYLIIYFFFIFLNISKAFRTGNKKEKTQLQYLLMGFSFALLIGIATNLILPLLGYNKLVKIGPPLSVVFFVGFTSYTIVTKQLFGINVILTQIVVGIMAIILFIQTLLSEGPYWRILNLTALLFFLFFSWLLIRYTFLEIKRREEAEKLSQAKSEFLSIASHQLRTPLTVIKGYLSMLLEGGYGQVEGQIKRVLENVYLANERLIRLVNDFLKASRIETGKIDLNLEKTNLETLIENVVSELEIKAKEKNLYLIFEKPKEPIPEILADKEKIREVLVNLIDNGIRYTKSGGIRVGFEQEKKFIRIFVQDTGEGLEKKDLEKLFESFSRGSAGEKLFVEGAGLGLYIAKKIVELHKGKIWAESEGKGKGSTFYVELPLR